MDTSRRLLSLDTLRGFDMMFIMGFASIVTAVCSLFPDGSNCWLATQMSHVSWNGLRHHDTIFPLFLFIAGISFPFSHARQKENGYSKGRTTAKIIRRGIILFMLGLIYGGLFNLDFAHLRIPSVLGRIGFAWMFAALLFINFKPKVRGIIAAAILIGYYLLIRFIPAPDMPGADPLSLEGNLVGYIDRTLMGDHLWNRNLFDPEGTLSLLPAIVTAMLGMFTGEFVRMPDEKFSGNRKTVYMFAAAAVMAAIGLLWSLDFPVNKKLWSSSFVLVVGAFSLASFALFYYIIDVRRWTKWTFFFKVIGMNSITIYMAQRIIPFGSISDFFFGKAAELCPGPVGNLIGAVTYFAVSWLFLYFLYRKKVFLKV